MVATKSKPLDHSQFAHTATRLAVAQICRSAGLKHAQSPALDALTAISTLYLRHLARSAAAHAALAGRTHCNLLDVVSALEDLAGPTGFTGASRVDNELMRSSTLRDIRRFVNVTKELPFAKPMPGLEDDHGSRVWVGDCRVVGDCESRPEIPEWLPEIPKLGDGFENHERNELYWEEKRVEEGGFGERKGVGEVDERRKRLPWKRERVKLKWRKEKLKVVLDSNGVGEVGKRVNGES